EDGHHRQGRGHAGLREPRPGRPRRLRADLRLRRQSGRHQAWPVDAAGHGQGRQLRSRMRLPPRHDRESDGGEMRTLFLAGTGAALVLGLAATVSAGPEKIAFPADFAGKYTLYGIIDRPDRNIIRYFYVN